MIAQLELPLDDERMTGKVCCLAKYKRAYVCRPWYLSAIVAFLLDKSDWSFDLSHGKVYLTSSQAAEAGYLVIDPEEPKDRNLSRVSAKETICSRCWDL